MGQVTYPDAVAIWKLIFYAPALLASVYVSYRHGFMKSSGWIFLTIFSIIRIVGSAAQLSSINGASEGAETTAAITGALGLSPLLLASLGLLSRAYFTILKKPWNFLFSFAVLKIVQTPAAIALILCIVGATSASSPAQIDSSSTLHIGIILYAVVLYAVALLTLGATVVWRQYQHRGEGLLIAAVALALPFLTVRVTYSLLAAFSKDSRFSIATGSTTIELFMATLPEAIVVLIYIWTGMELRTVPQGEHSDSARKTLTYRLGRGDFGPGKLGLLSLVVALLQVSARGAKADEKNMDEQDEVPADSWSQQRIPQHKEGAGQV